MNVVKTKKVNTNNAWGFGGMIGTYTYYDNGMVHKKGRVYYRHLSSSSINHWKVCPNPDERDFCIDIAGKQSKQVFIYQAESSYSAYYQEQPTLDKWGMDWKLIKTINL